MTQEQNTGTVTVLNAELGYGFVMASDGKQIFFSRESKFSDGLQFEDVAIGDDLAVVSIETERGPFAQEVTRKPYRTKSKRQEKSAEA